MDKKREIFFFKNYFRDFYGQQTEKVKNKILWTLRIIEELERVPEVYLKHLKDTSGLYEIRVKTGSDIYRIFCFFDIGSLVVVGNGFQKKTKKTPKQEIERAEKIRKEYYGNKK